DVLEAVINGTINKQHKNDYISEVQQNINFRVLYHIMNLAAHHKVHPQVNAIANAKLSALKSRLISKSDINSREMIRRINRFLKFPDKFEIMQAPKIPDGSPIGMDCMN
ncbi:MAG: peptidase, partial [Maribacter sp.]|nr:peptidase [Maribacter sp.]